MTLIFDEARRDTDADWRRLGEVDPYWGVLNAPEFRRGVMVEDDRNEFYRTGDADVQRFADLIAQHTGRAPTGRALDFGCGVGRLTEAIARHADEAVGYDISDGMVAEARTRSGRPTYTTVLPEGPFDWINSYIVFQHIPPAKGMAQLDRLLPRLAPGGALSLQFAFEPHGGVRPPRPEDSAPSQVEARGRDTVPTLERWWIWTAWAVRVLINPDTAGPRPFSRPPPTLAEAALPPGAPPLGHICMFGYDLSAVLSRLRAHGIGDVFLHGVDHGGWYGYVLIGRRDAAAPPASE